MKRETNRIRRKHETDPRLAAAAASGAYLDFKGQDMRPEWLLTLGELTPERITAVFAWERAQSQEIIHMPSSFAVAHLTMLEHSAKAKAQTLLAAKRERDHVAEAEQREKRRQDEERRGPADRARVQRLLQALEADPALVRKVPPVTAQRLEQLRQAYEDGKPLWPLLAILSLPLALQAIMDGDGEQGKAIA